MIAHGGPFYFPKADGRLFGNRSKDLPGNAEYREFTVPTPGLDHRGKRRIVARSNGILFFTACHYDRVPGNIDSKEHASKLEEVDEQWRNSFYVITGVPPLFRTKVISSLKQLRDSRLPAPIKYV